MTITNTTKRALSALDQDEHNSDQTTNPIHNKPIQVNPLHAEKLVRQIMEKPKWQIKINSAEIVNKWLDESERQGISESSFSVALEILQDLDHLGHSVKTCCGHCGAHPVKKTYTDANSDQEIDPEEDLFENGSLEPTPKKKKVGETTPVGDECEDDDEKYFPRSTRFCLCPCIHCAFIEKSVYSDVCLEQNNLIPAELTERIKKHLDALVDSTPSEKLDWHPGSNQQVLDIIHPSLYCYSKQFSVLNTNTTMDSNNSKKIVGGLKGIRTQWLPTDFHVDKHGKIKPLSYINNINPTSQKDLQDSICEVLQHFIEPFKKFVPIKDKIQVIIKAANVIVKPEDGFYPGGTWHTEGDSENIVATGIFYYECQNVKQSFLEFRTSLKEDDFYDIEQDGVQQAWDEHGIHDGDKLFQVLGRVSTTEGKCIIFPNTNQHRVRHFFPEDPTKTATRKILVFFLVNPEKEIVSTSNIDNQRRDIVVSNSLSLCKLITFPVLMRHVIPFIPLMTLEQAHSVREKLMESRKYKRDKQNELFEREYSLCEH